MWRGRRSSRQTRGGGRTGQRGRRAQQRHGDGLAEDAPGDVAQGAGDVQATSLTLRSGSSAASPPRCRRRPRPTSPRMAGALAEGIVPGHVGRRSPAAVEEDGQAGPEGPTVRPRHWCFCRGGCVHDCSSALPGAYWRQRKDLAAEPVGPLRKERGRPLTTARPVLRVRPWRSHGKAGCGKSFGRLPYPISPTRQEVRG